MRLPRRYVGVALASVMVTAVASAQSDDQGGIAPLPSDTSMTRITPDGPSDADSIFTTHKPGTLPWKANAPTGPSAAPQPVQAIPSASPFNTTPAVGNSSGAMPDKVPFGHASLPPVIPAGPHATTSAPVADVDAVEVSEPAPATPVVPEADPAKEDPANPTELTSPIFDASSDNGGPRKIVLRVLNKVTGQSERLDAKPNDLLKFGRLDILPVTCRTSLPTSQRDDAALLDIVEHLPGTNTVKPVFHGWMYASSPSITSLEHPIYDVTMVACEIADHTPPAPKTAKKK